MSEPEARPDPDAILRRVQDGGGARPARQAEDLLRRRARRRQDLRDARGRADRDARGVDVVVGVVETHGAPETDGARCSGSSCSPRQRRRVPRALARGVRPRRGARAPARHCSWSTSSPTPTRRASRHAKRWQDVLELLDAGIDVYTTLNVQHVESLNDVVAQITGVHVRETVPDSILERADEIELVDLPPEELLAAPREGKVYVPEQAARARRALLPARATCSRCASSRCGAPRSASTTDVRELPRAARRDRRPGPPASASSSASAPAPSGARLIRAARRMAAGLRAPWVAAYVDAAALADERRGPRPARGPPAARGVPRRHGRPAARRAHRRGGHAARRANQARAARRGADADQDALARRPGLDHAVLLAKLAHVLVHVLRDPPQRELAQRQQVPAPEELVGGAARLLGQVDLALAQTP